MRVEREGKTDEKNEIERRWRAVADGQYEARRRVLQLRNIRGTPRASETHEV